MLKTKEWEGDGKQKFVFHLPGYDKYLISWRNLQVDKYCDRNFAFNFARKLKYKEVKTTALTTLNSQKNKSINTYVNYNNFEFDSGESY